jgi:patatin-like phospholipase/acyl hydrolase
MTVTIDETLPIEPIRVLSLNGGGVRGLFTISVLAQIERNIENRTSAKDVKIGDYFDLITGTSIGGILALGLASGKSARDLEPVFFENALKIFPPQKDGFKKLVKQIFSPLYDSKPLYKTVVSMIGTDSTFNDLQRRVLIPAINLSTGKPQFFKTPHNPDFTRDGVLKLSDAAMATSAAPTYFAPHYCEDLTAYFADGGLVANNPSFIGLHEVLRDMKSDFPDATVKDVRILNVGTLANDYCISPKLLMKNKKGGYGTLWGGGQKLVLTTMTANQHLHQNMLKRELATHNAESNYVYLDDSIPNEAASDITLDNASLASLQNLKSRGIQLATEEFSQNKHLQAFFNKPAPTFK